MFINGRTRVIVHLAYPAAHLRTPEFFNAFVAAAGQNAVLVPWQVTPERLRETWTGLSACESLAGVIVTIPHKGSVADLCDSLEGPASFLGVANVARRLPDGRFVGRMYDGVGYVNGLHMQGHEIAGRRVLLIGAGGAAAGIAHALVEYGAAAVTVHNRTEAKAEALAERLNAVFEKRCVVSGPADGRGHDIVINATSLGLRDGDPLPMDVSTLDRTMLVGEVVMQPDETRFLAAAAQLGCCVHKGRHMIEGQIPALADFLLGDQG